MLAALPTARLAEEPAAPDTLQILEGLIVEEIRIDGAKNTKPHLIRGAMVSRVGEP